jgi:2,4-didehydro-3-deoxy-L-rhamnonate hydrolase
MPFRYATVSGRAALVSADDRWFDIERLSNGAIPADPMRALAQHQEFHALAATLDDRPGDGALGDATLGPAVPTPRSSFAIGLNYLNHAAESSMELPAAPLTFSKFPSCLVGANDDVVLNTHAGDYEVELVVVIGRTARNVSEADAWDSVLGVTGGQDISDRALQFAAKPPHFDLGKSRDTFGPIGPVIVSTDSLPNPDAIGLRCWINGELRQDGNTKDLIFSVPKLIAYLSSILTLQVGDVIFTGTPEGVGAAKGTFLRPGDVIESEIAGIGRLRNVCG